MSIDYAAPIPDRRAIRIAAERAGNDLNSTIGFHLSVWEGREGWSDHPTKARDEHGQKALRELEGLADTIADLAKTLRARLRVDGNLAFDDSDPYELIVSAAANTAMKPGDDGWETLTGWQQGVRYFWDEETVREAVTAKFREMRRDGADRTAPAYTDVVAEVGAYTAAQLWEELAPSQRPQGYRGTDHERGSGGYTQATRTPRDLDPQDGTVWDLPRDAEYDDPDDPASGYADTETTED